MDDLEVYTTTGVFLILWNSRILMPPARFSGSKSSIPIGAKFWGVLGFLPFGGVWGGRSPPNVGEAKRSPPNFYTEKCSNTVVGERRTRFLAKIWTISPPQISTPKINTVWHLWHLWKVWIFNEKSNISNILDFRRFRHFFSKNIFEICLDPKIYFWDFFLIQSFTN